MKTPDDPTFVYGNFEVWVCQRCYGGCSIRIRNTVGIPERCPYHNNQCEWQPRLDVKPLEFYGEEGEL